ncbi:glucose dehydrogenase [Paracoccus sp. JM45]|uniref:glucose dehydrogenase n=1 Tax=Paracoccus sp. JM45 TaxID=2283626 RepID=UPI000E6B60C8|nr:glucose dehydrogenase [Paracoccus sp. JM45]RJE79641.1 glucose dehydrogenase [Paracoccus sp. JM45]
MATDGITKRRAPVGWGVRILAWVCILFGAVLFSGGVWLMALGGSWYYGIAGLGLVITGALLNRGNILAVWIYAAIWAATMVWAWWESGSDLWAQVPRMLSPTVILVAVLLCIPALTRAGQTRAGQLRH